MSESTDYFKAKYKTLQDLPGIGEGIEAKLHDIGYRTVEALATAPPKELIDGGIGEATAHKIIEAARKAIAIAFITADKYQEMRKGMKKMTTGTKTLDNLLEGGLETQSITEFYGEYGSGKSQICQQLAASVQLPEDQGGLNGNCLYIDTEHVFRPDRIEQMAIRLGMDPNETLKRIVFAEAYTSQHQMTLLENCDEIVKEFNVRLIVVDSLTGHFRSEYLGRETLAPRQQQLNRHMHKLIRLARAFNAAVAVTNQVSDVPDMYARRQVKPIGGHIVGHIAHTRIFLRKGRDNLRIAKIVASPFLPEGEAPIRITDAGIEGDEELD